MTKTQAALTARIAQAKAAGRTSIDVNGSREVAAARKLAEAGAATFTSTSGMSGGKYYVHPITRTGATTKPVFVWAGHLEF